MSKRLFSEVVSGSCGCKSSDDSKQRTVEKTPVVKSLAGYQLEDEDTAVQKALQLSKVMFLKLVPRGILMYVNF